MSTKGLLCYNKGCGKEFDPENNADESCVYHPGVPVFHDALKGWSCCNKKSTDFSTFLSIPGCSKGQHTNVKPPEPEKPKEDPNKKETIVVEPPKIVERMERPSSDEPLIDLPIVVAPTLNAALEKLKESASNVAVEGENKTIPIGTSCKNHGCQATYQGEQSDKEKCYHHPGTAIFHEGMKYWSCCERKTSDFNTFLGQAGCTESKHNWTKKETNNEDKSTSCRYDFHQTGGNAIVTVFSKNPVPNESTIKANRVVLDINITFEGGNKEFSRKLDLYGVVDIENSQVQYYPSKVEIKLKKAEPISWKKLENV